MRVEYSPHSDNQALTALIAAGALLSLLWYGVFLFDPRHFGHPLSYVLLLAAEIVGMIQVLGIWLSLLISPSHPPLPEVSSIRRDLADGKLKPSVAVFITVCGEDPAVVRKTAAAARDMHVAHRTVLLDDGDSAEVRAVAREVGVEYITRPEKDGKKAGNINYALTQVKTDFFSVIDCDHVPRPEFLLEMLPYLLKDAKLAFVQTPQYFGNTNMFVSGGSAEMQEVFYRHIQPRKNLQNSAFCVGTNVTFRREALMELGGIYDGSNSEDIWTSLILHEKGWKSLFLPTVLAVGETPETVDSFFRQQTRWAKGGFEILLGRNPLANPKLTWGQRLQYFHTTFYYMSGFSVLFFYVLPLLYIYFGWKPLESGHTSAIWILHFLPYYVMTFFSNAYLLGRAPLWRSFVMTQTAFPAHLSAFFSALTGKTIRWSVTGTIKRKSDYLTSVAPHLLLMLLTAGAIPVILLQPGERPLALIFFLWMTWNLCALFAVCKRAIPRYAHAIEEPTPVSYAPAS